MLKMLRMFVCQRMTTIVKYELGCKYFPENVFNCIMSCIRKADIFMLKYENRDKMTNCVGMCNWGI